MATNATKKMKTDLKCQVCGDNSFGINYGAGNLHLTLNLVLS